MNFHAFLFDFTDEFLHAVPWWSREIQFDGRGSQLRYQIIQHLQSHQHHHRSNSCSHIHTRSASQSDSCRHPQTSSRSQAPDHILLEDDGTGTQESDTRNHLGSNARGILQIKAKSILGNDTEKRTTQGYQEVSSEPRLLGTVFSFDAYRSS